MTVTLWTEPKVSVIASTCDMADIDKWETHVDDTDSSLEAVSVFAGRACYQSFGYKAGRRTADEYLGHIMDSKHFSVLEHSSVTFYIEGVSRSLTHELIRHRHFSYSQESQRYVDYSEDIGIVVPPLLVDFPYDCAAFERVGRVAQEEYQIFYVRAIQRAESRKQAREAARAVLPNCTETKIVVTGNLRSWMEFLEKRDSEHADAEIQRLAKVIRAELERLAPHVFRRKE